jgi:hypothetical protein
MEKVDDVPTASTRNLKAIEDALKAHVRFNDEGCVCPIKRNAE